MVVCMLDEPESGLLIFVDAVGSGCCDKSWVLVRLSEFVEIVVAGVGGICVQLDLLLAWGVVLAVGETKRCEQTRCIVNSVLFELIKSLQNESLKNTCFRVFLSFNNVPV